MLRYLGCMICPVGLKSAFSEKCTRSSVRQETGLNRTRMRMAAVETRAEKHSIVDNPIIEYLIIYVDT